MIKPFEWFKGGGKKRGKKEEQDIGGLNIEDTSVGNINIKEILKKIQTQLDELGEGEINLDVNNINELIKFAIENGIIKEEISSEDIEEINRIINQIYERANQESDLIPSSLREKLARINIKIASVIASLTTLLPLAAQPEMPLPEQPPSYLPLTGVFFVGAVVTGIIATILFRRAYQVSREIVSPPEREYFGEQSFGEMVRLNQKMIYDITAIILELKKLRSIIQTSERESKNKSEIKIENSKKLSNSVNRLIRLIEELRGNQQSLRDGEYNLAELISELQEFSNKLEELTLSERKSSLTPNEVGEFLRIIENTLQRLDYVKAYYENQLSQMQARFAHYQSEAANLQLQRSAQTRSLRGFGVVAGGLAAILAILSLVAASIHFGRNTQIAGLEQAEEIARHQREVLEAQGEAYKQSAETSEAKRRAMEENIRDEMLRQLYYLLVLGNEQEGGKIKQLMEEINKDSRLSEEMKVDLRKLFQYEIKGELMDQKTQLSEETQRYLEQLNRELNQRKERWKNEEEKFLIMLRYLVAIDPDTVNKLAGIIQREQWNKAEFRKRLENVRGKLLDDLDYYSKLISYILDEVRKGKITPEEGKKIKEILELDDRIDSVIKNIVILDKLYFIFR
ncbi:MAG: hypothetical protein NZ822_03070 [Patescibacteria group bacterium]|nr:hypothetical protein [Patescibacteria group bacterium]